MSEQNETNVSTKPRRSRHTKQYGTQAPIRQHPAHADKEAWEAYWKAQGQPWRTEPEIDVARQLYLEERRDDFRPDEKEGVYPFRGIKLNRADIEWLLATHEDGRGPINWNDESQREREGLDLRGADLREVDLVMLPLARIIAGPRRVNFDEISEQDKAAIVHLEGACLDGAHLEGALLIRACLERTWFEGTYLDNAILTAIEAEHTCFLGARLEGAWLNGSNLKMAKFNGSNLKGAHFNGASLQGAYFFHAQLEGTDLEYARLEGAGLDYAFFDGKTNLEGVTFSSAEHGNPTLVDIHWGDVNVGAVDWSIVSILGDESYADQNQRESSTNKNFEHYQTASRAYRQLSVVLRNQGLNEDAARFAYRANLMQRKVFWYQHKIWQYLGSLFLDVLSGHGYRAGRCFIVYALVISIFATIYHSLGNQTAWNESIVISMTAFHGRGFFPEQFKPSDPQAMVAAIEAFLGLLIEVTFIATLTQRFFGK
jgi:uncharacterized protein YjbI with pentapeptide repeats